MLLERNAATGREVHVEEKDGLLIVRKTVPKDVMNKYLDHNKAEQNAIPQKSYKSELRKKKYVEGSIHPNHCHRAMEERGD